MVISLEGGFWAVIYIPRPPAVMLNMCQEHNVSVAQWREGAKGVHIS